MASKATLHPYAGPRRPGHRVQIAGNRHTKQRRHAHDSSSAKSVSMEVDIGAAVSIMSGEVFTTHFPDKLHRRIYEGSRRDRRLRSV